MNNRIKTKWIEALKSGDYKQGVHALKTNSEGEVKYCCLGVLCDLYAKENKKRWGKPSNLYPTFMKQVSVLPKEVMEWAGLEEESGTFRYKRRPNSLMNLNDRERFSFKDIAKIIERYF